MKVLVMSEEKWEALDDIFYSEREVIALHKAMTTIDIPEGCVLAVVDTDGVPLGEMLEIKPDFIEGISFSVSHHRRVIQEVKL